MEPALLIIMPPREWPIQSNGRFYTDPSKNQIKLLLSYLAIATLITQLDTKCCRVVLDSASCLITNDLCIVAKGKDASSRYCSLKEFGITNPIPGCAAGIRYFPCLKSVTIEAMNGNDTGIGEILDIVDKDLASDRVSKRKDNLY